MDFFETGWLSFLHREMGHKKCSKKIDRYFYFIQFIITTTFID